MSLQLAWQSRANQTWDQKVAIHLVDGTGKILSQVAYPQDNADRHLQAGETWVDRVVNIPVQQLRGVEAIGLCLFRQGVGALPADRGRRDYNGRRLLMPIVAPPMRVAPTAPAAAADEPIATTNPATARIPATARSPATAPKAPRVPASVRTGIALDPNEAARLADDTMPELRDVTFGDRFILIAATAQRVPDGLKLNLAWKSQVAEPLRYTVAVHIVDVDGKILSQADYAQDKSQKSVAAGATWQDIVTIPTQNLTGGHAVAVALYTKKDGRVNEALPADRGPRDWGNYRLLIPLP
jgi:hypothetical protein